MTLPASIRTNVSAPWPTVAQGGVFITVNKSNGIWTISVDYTKLAQALSIPDPTIKTIAVYDEVSKQYNWITLQQIAAVVASIVSTSGLAGAVLNTYRIVTAAGDVAIAPTDQTILLNKTVGASTNIVLPASSVRVGAPVTVKDLKGDAQTNNIRFEVSGSETIDGFTQAQADANGVSLVDINYGKKMLFPLSSGGWYL